MLNPRLEQLSDYPFRRLARLLDAAPAPPERLRPIDLSIGQPMHPVPELIAATLAGHAHLWNRYPPVNGTPDFRAAVAEWLTRRYRLPAGTIDPERHVLPVAGTKEALFMLPQLVMRERGARPAAVLMPNPFYNVYLGGALMAGAEPVLLPVSAGSNHLPALERLPEDLLARTIAFYLCSPSNPQGTAASPDYLRRALELARRFGFLLIADECYSEIYPDEPPAGALQAAVALGGALDNLIVCNSLSKRSSAAGLRSGFVAGDAALLAGFNRLRSYGAAVQPLPVLAAAAALWREETHVEANRALYRDKHALAADRLSGRYGYYRPDGGFFLWLKVGDGEDAARRLWSEAGVKVLPGGYLGRPDARGEVPGREYIRLALVHERAATAEALDRLVATLS